MAGSVLALVDCCLMASFGYLLLCCTDCSMLVLVLSLDVLELWLPTTLTSSELLANNFCGNIAPFFVCLRWFWVDCVEMSFNLQLMNYFIKSENLNFEIVLIAFIKSSLCG